MTVRFKRKLRGADGGKHPHVKNSQDFPKRVIDPNAMLLMQTKQYLGSLEWWTRRGCNPPERLEVAAKAACGALRDWLEGKTA